MTRRRNDGWDGESGGLFGAYALGGPALAGLYGAARSTREGGGGLGDLGDAPIGSDPWLRSEIGAALRRVPALIGSEIQVEVREMNVTLRGQVAGEALVATALQTAKEVPGVGRVHSELGWPSGRGAL